MDLLTSSLLVKKKRSNVLFEKATKTRVRHKQVCPTFFFYSHLSSSKSRSVDLIIINTVLGDKHTFLSRHVQPQAFVIFLFTKKINCSTFC